MPCRLPIDCVLAVTYKCNSRCVMCDIWKIKNFPELPPSEYAKLPPTLRDINLSGGEPFLRLDLPEIVSVVKKACPKARLVISSNGFATALILAQMKKILAIKRDIGVAISIDGIGERHDEMRGIPGGFAMAMDTTDGLKKLGMKNLRLGFTVTERNINELGRVYNLAREKGVQFTHSFAQSSDFYFGGKQNTDFKDMNPPLIPPSERGGISDEELSEGMALGQEHEKSHIKALRQQYHHLIKEELKGWNLKRWARAYFAHGMYNFITSKHPALSGAPGRDFFFLDPSGEFYPSVVHNFKMGSIKAITPFNPPLNKGEEGWGSFEQFWCSKEVEDLRRKIYAAKLPVWMICTARTAIKKHPFKVGWWVFRNKFFSGR